MAPVLSQQHGIPGKEEYLWLEPGHTIRHTTYENAMFVFRTSTSKGGADKQEVIAIRPMIASNHAEL